MGELKHGDEGSTRTGWETDEAVPPPSCALVVRQPIFGPALEVAAYELLYPTDGAERALVPDAAQAAAQVVINATLDIGFRRLVGDLPAFIRFPADLLASPFQLPLAPERIVIEVPGRPAWKTGLLEGLMRMRSEGYRIALHDLDVRRDGTDILDYVDIVKVDIRRHSRQELVHQALELRGFRLQLVAENVGTREELLLCRELGFDLFQGDFLQHPETFVERRAPTSRMATLELVQLLQDVRVPADQLETCIVRDAGLSYRLLRCINSSYYRTPRVVGSMLHAILLLGYDELRRLCSVVLLTSMKDRPPYVAVQALTRARMCETLCAMAGLPGKGGYFMTGLLSMADVLLGAPMRDCVRDLPLSEQVRSALLEQQGSMGSALRCVLGYERGDWEETEFEGLPATGVSSAYAQAVEWAESVHAALQGR